MKYEILDQPDNDTFTYQLYKEISGTASGTSTASATIAVPSSWSLLRTLTPTTTGDWYGMYVNSSNGSFFLVTLNATDDGWNIYSLTNLEAGSFSLVGSATFAAIPSWDNPYTISVGSDIWKLPGNAVSLPYFYAKTSSPYSTWTAPTYTSTARANDTTRAAISFNSAIPYWNSTQVSYINTSTFAWTNVSVAGITGAGTTSWAKDSTRPYMMYSSTNSSNADRLVRFATDYSSYDTPISLPGDVVGKEPGPSIVFSGNMYIPMANLVSGTKCIKIPDGGGTLTTEAIESSPITGTLIGGTMSIYSSALYYIAAINISGTLTIKIYKRS